MSNIRINVALLMMVQAAFFSLVWFAPVSAQEKESPAMPAAETGTLTSSRPGEDVVCQSDVFFSWQKRPKEKKDEQGRIIVEAPPPPVEAFFATISTSGIAETDVRTRLNSMLPQAKAQALERCRSTHEDFAGCISNRLRSQAADYNVLDYSARHSVLAAIENDCSYALGTCLAAASKDIRCFLNKPLEVKASEGSAPDDKKDAKEKKKK